MGETRRGAAADGEPMKRSAGADPLGFSLYNAL
jgi:hypothetical protein